jgi:hypothetical protein
LMNRCFVAKSRKNRFRVVTADMHSLSLLLITRMILYIIWRRYMK